MKALSIKQPWAYMITNCGKDIENRDWYTRLRGEFLIHAGKKVDRAGYEFAENNGIELPSELPTGGIVGRAKIVDCVDESDSPWFFGHYGFVIEDAKPLPFKPCLGRLSFFEYDYNDESI